MKFTVEIDMDETREPIDDITSVADALFVLSREISYMRIYDKSGLALGKSGVISTFECDGIGKWEVTN